MKKRLILDLDDVLGDLVGEWLSIYNELWEDNLQTEDITDWDISQFTKPECGKAIYSLLNPVGNTSLWDKMQPMDDAVEIVNYLNDLTNVFVVSSVTGNYDICKYKHNWLTYHFPFLDSKKFYFVTDKSAIDGGWMVDDYYKNMLSFNGRRILFDRPHNRKITVADGIANRARDWHEVYDIIVQEL